ncbi:GNAT family N-acetyltransferase [Crossiella cryophila]|uniref:RimJ/RimL family protein N-acetyltransferase n=1 Tax=Crossiella cryophila TaxID=43355 RepID=A0A7W7FYQ7_9PSEU|nr:GNAT family N-acetyltransferase [Crossiella cryophila]MBB4682400.1 RimJ/RimL family protein N-acetyltransferase [Crossiella cryophila]
MPILVEPALPTGHLRDRPQPRLSIDDELTLRPWQAGDAEAVRTAFGCPEIQRWHVRRIDTAAEALDWIEGWGPRWLADRDVSWAVVGPADEVLGQAGFRGLDLVDATAEVSYWVLPSARGRGVAVRAARAVVGWSFAELGLARLGLRHSTANLGSCRVAERAGFALEGTLRSAARHADGRHDMHLHAVVSAAS